MNIARLLGRTAATYPDQPALAHGKNIVASYQEFDDQAAGLAGALRGKLGLKAGDRVALIMKNHPEYWIALFAVWRAGLVAVPVNAKLHINEFRYILEDSGSRLAFATPELATDLTPLTGELPDLDAVISIYDDGFQALKKEPAIECQDASGDDLAWLFYTSGTTGKPKGAMLSHRNLLAATLSYFADVTSHDPGDCMIHAAPQTHGSGLYGLPLIAKGGIQVTPQSGGFDPAETLDLIAHYPNCCFFFAPTMVHRLISSPAFEKADTRNLKIIVYGGGPMYEADIRRAITALGPRFAQIYGQGESPMTITGLTLAMIRDENHPRRSQLLASVGVERTDVEVRVVDENDTPLPTGDIGEIVVRGDVVMQGYWKNPEATKEALRGGWLHTGDMGCFDADGFLTLKDRSKDLIISGGTNIYPREIEEALLTHPDVAEISVVGRPHADWGEEVIAFIVPRRGTQPTIDELDRHCTAQIARFKRPKEYIFIDELPKNNYGKVLKTELRARFTSPSG
ncbi:MAG: AMP-dependent synthetase [Sneathiella sp.]|jgi:acyl-CoA synthetase (AMP-forming)/AMP-acid ligase II|uniref:acyl-CoA synthetase n=1 Tax=Sneathiella sp. TaxID=1964365 RepID=UPI000C4476B2|nr:long-chain fatty acid--CoA ligase [Sneathiella sp.]MAL79332.1 AMP-dependent synthetase [Sneathiella sp.]